MGGFDRGYGIGGLGQHAEEGPTPTAEQVERVVRQERRARRCSSCGCSSLDGAMFTTDASSGLCDDCY